MAEGGTNPFRLLGWALQLIGMAIMFFGFITLITGIQKTVSYATNSISSTSGVLPSKPPAKCDPKTDELCGIDFTQEGAAEKVFSAKVYNFIGFLGFGLMFMFMGLGLRSIQEIGAAIGGGKKKEEKFRAGQWYGPKGRSPF